MGALDRLTSLVRRSAAAPAPQQPGPLGVRGLASALWDRLQWMRQAGLGYGGARDYYSVLGYDRVITTRQYRDEYYRGGIAKRIVEAFPKATWRGGVSLFEDENPEISTEFEDAWFDLETRLNIWSTFLKADILAGLSTYSVILIGSKLDGNFSRPLPQANGPQDLIYLQPFSGGGGPTGNNRNVNQGMDSDCSIREYDLDPTSSRFGEPLFYQLRRVNVTSPAFMEPIHWTRIVHIAEGCLDDNVFGVPTLENVWNLLQDLLKVTGGGAEAFWLRANAGLNLNLDKEVTMDKEDQANLKDEIDDYRHDISRVIKTRGMQLKQLGSDVANFSNPAEAILTQIAGSKGIPMRILTGSERGELASTQDAANFNTQVQDRRTNYAGPLIVRRLVDRLIEYGYLPEPKQYEVGWPTVESMSEMEKAGGAKAWADVNVALAQAQMPPAYTSAEIREHWSGMKPLSDADLAAAKGPVEEPDPALEAVAPEEVAAALKAAGDPEMLRVLEAAIREKNVDVVHRIAGLA